MTPAGWLIITVGSGWDSGEGRWTRGGLGVGGWAGAEREELFCRILGVRSVGLLVI